MKIKLSAMTRIAVFIVFISGQAHAIGPADANLLGFQASKPSVPVWIDSTGKIVGQVIGDTGVLVFVNGIKLVLYLEYISQTNNDGTRFQGLGWNRNRDRYTLIYETTDCSGTPLLGNLHSAFGSARGLVTYKDAAGQFQLVTGTPDNINNYTIRSSFYDSYCHVLPAPYNTRAYIADPPIPLAPFGVPPFFIN